MKKCVVCGEIKDKFKDDSFKHICLDCRLKYNIKTKNKPKDIIRVYLAENLPSKEIINKILYLTHDKWNDKTKPKYRKEFEDFLKVMVNRQPKVEEFLETLYEYSNKDDKLLIMKGAHQILKEHFPEDYDFVVKRIYSKNKKKELGF